MECKNLANITGSFNQEISKVEYLICDLKFTPSIMLISLEFGIMR